MCRRPRFWKPLAGSRPRTSPDWRRRKGDIASEAERLAAGTGWMPAIFRSEGPQQTGQDAPADGEAKHRKKWPPWRMTSRRPRLWPRDFAP